jgi:hypothetical protein
MYQMFVINTSFLLSIINYFQISLFLQNLADKKYVLFFDYQCINEKAYIVARKLFKSALFFATELSNHYFHTTVTCTLYKRDEKVTVLDRKDFNEDMIYLLSSNFP